MRDRGRGGRGRDCGGRGNGRGGHRRDRGEGRRVQARVSIHILMLREKDERNQYIGVQKNLFTQILKNLKAHTF